MASTLNKLTGMGGDVRKIAALLQKKAPPGHKLAYINEEEAALLKSRGGSGKPHADTGIPSFEDEGLGSEMYQDYGPPSTGTSYLPTPTGGMDVASELAPPASPATQLDYSAPSSAGFGVQQFGTPASRLSGGAGAGISAAPSALPTDISVPESPKYGLTSGQSLADVTGTAAPKEEGYADRLANALGIKKDTLKNLGVAGITGLVGARTAGRAAQAGQAGKAEMQALAAPYQQQGQALQAQAQRGELTPQAQQSLQAVQAQAAQQAERRGGVGQAQMQQQVEAFRQQLLSQQYDYGLKLSGIGDNIALGAIRTGLQADQYVQQLTGNYFNNMARAVYGTAPQAAGVQYATQQAVT